MYQIIQNIPINRTHLSSPHFSPQPMMPKECSNSTINLYDRYLLLEPPPPLKKTLSPTPLNPKATLT